MTLKVVPTPGIATMPHLHPVKLLVANAHTTAALDELASACSMREKNFSLVLLEEDEINRLMTLDNTEDRHVELQKAVWGAKICVRYLYSKNTNKFGSDYVGQRDYVMPANRDWPHNTVFVATL